jgi:hypothetical protein
MKAVTEGKRKKTGKEEQTGRGKRRRERALMLGLAVLATYRGATKSPPTFPGCVDEI